MVADVRDSLRSAFGQHRQHATHGAKRTIFRRGHVGRQRHFLDGCQGTTCVSRPGPGEPLHVLHGESAVVRGEQQRAARAQRTQAIPGELAEVLLDVKAGAVGTNCRGRRIADDHVVDSAVPRGFLRRASHHGERVIHEEAMPSRIFAVEREIQRGPGGALSRCVDVVHPRGSSDQGGNAERPGMGKEIHHHGAAAACADHGPTLAMVDEDAHARRIRVRRAHQQSHARFMHDVGCGRIAHENFHLALPTGDAEKTDGVRGVLLVAQHAGHLVELLRPLGRPNLEPNDWAVAIHHEPVATIRDVVDEAEHVGPRGHERPSTVSSSADFEDHGHVESALSGAQRRRPPIRVHAPEELFEERDVGQDGALRSHCSTFLLGEQGVHVGCLRR